MSYRHLQPEHHILPSPVIVVPGIKASDLDDEYELPPRSRLDHTAQETPRANHAARRQPSACELLEPALVTPRGPFPLVDEELIEELRASTPCATVSTTNSMASASTLPAFRDRTFLVGRPSSWWVRPDRMPDQTCWKPRTGRSRSSGVLSVRQSIAMGT